MACRMVESGDQRSSDEGTSSSSSTRDSFDSIFVGRRRTSPVQFVHVSWPLRTLEVLLCACRASMTKRGVAGGGALALANVHERNGCLGVAVFTCYLVQYLYIFLLLYMLYTCARRASYLLYMVQYSGSVQFLYMQLWSPAGQSVGVHFCLLYM